MDLRKSALFFTLLVVLSIKGLSQKTLLTEAQVMFYMGMNGEGGTNGVAVTYNPEKQLFYACIGGNQVFPLEVFNKNGENLFYKKCGFDSRGLWYNARKKRLEGKNFGNEIYYFDFNILGFPEEAKPSGIELQGAGNMNLATYDEKLNQYIVLDEQTLKFYSATNGKLKKSIPIKLNSPADNYVAYAFVWTGIKGYEIGFFNLINYNLEFYNLKSGIKSGEIYIPLDYNAREFFNISYANGYFFVFDIEYREWAAFKIWNE